jgi:hypothetical protein
MTMTQNDEHTPHEKASNLHQQVSQTAAKFTERAAKKTEDLTSATLDGIQGARDSVTSGVEQKRDELTAQLRRISAAIHEGADRLRTSDPKAARWMDLATGRFDQATSYVTQSDLRTVLHDTERFARSKPWVFFGGALLAGLAVGRFLRSSSSQGSQGSASGEFWRPNETGLRTTRGMGESDS